MAPSSYAAPYITKTTPVAGRPCMPTLFFCIPFPMTTSFSSLRCSVAPLRCSTSISLFGLIPQIFVTILPWRLPVELTDTDFTFTPVPAAQKIVHLQEEGRTGPCFSVIFLLVTPFFLSNMVAKLHSQAPCAPPVTTFSWSFSSWLPFKTSISP